MKPLKLWQRNVIGAVVSAAALATATVFIISPAWEEYQRTVTPAHVATAKQPITVDGLTWSVRTAGRSTVDPVTRRPLPEGTVRFNVIVERDGVVPAGFGCVGMLTDGHRSWRAYSQSCGAADNMPWSFEVPASAEPTAVDVTTYDGSILVRLEL